MTLALIELDPTDEPLTASIEALLGDAQARIEEFVDSVSPEPIIAFVPSDFSLVARWLRSIAELMLASGHRFVEWGSGLGVVTCLAAEFGFDAIGIEIEPTLVELSRGLAFDHGCDVEFVAGSFLPVGAEQIVDRQEEIAWLRIDGPSAYALLDLDPDDFDVVFAYPWPGEEQIVFDLFEQYASVGALLMTFHGMEGVRLQRKVKR